ncbi:MAG TPA: hypothetical protein PKD78_03770, partial [Saprospiraceae bacterium]|nr:hypothetical protein [Saprospiraceae bacterium]
MKADLLHLAQSKLLKGNIQLLLDDYDRRHLAQQETQGAVYVCNQLLPGLDEWVLLAVLGEHFEELRILHAYP